MIKRARFWRGGEGSFARDPRPQFPHEPRASKPRVSKRARALAHNLACMIRPVVILFPSAASAAKALINMNFSNVNVCVCVCARVCHGIISWRFGAVVNG